MIKYRVKGNFLSEKGKLQDVCSDFFQNCENPFKARIQAKNYLSSWADLIIGDFNQDFQSTFQQKSKIELEGEEIEYISKYGIAVEFTIDDLEFYEIDYFGIFDNDFYDSMALGLETEFDYYKENNFKYENSQIITYLDKEEDEPTTFEILETSLDFSDKDKPNWWLSYEEKKQIVKEYIQERQIERAFRFGENNFIEFKPSLLYNFKTQQASIGVKNIIAKVICSFLNTNGGKLLIGVNDKGEIQGLDYDFSLKTKDNEFDFFRNEFDNLLFQFFDKNIYNYIKADFNSDYDKPFFIISVKPSDIPFFLINKKENTKEFYIRTITSSVPISDIEEVVKYCLTHWRNDN